MIAPRRSDRAMGKRATAKDAPSAKKAKSGADDETCSTERPPMNKAEISKMLGTLKYSTKAVKASTGEKQEAETALATYSALDQNKKRDFLEAFQKNKGNLKWISNFGSKTVEEEKHKAGIVEHWWNRSQIFKDQGIEYGQMSTQEQEDMLKDILADNRHQHGHSFKEQASFSGNPQLHKYYYVKDSGVKRTWEQTDSTTFSEDADIKDKDLKALSASANASASAGITIKNENPQFQEFKQKLGVLASGKKVLELVASKTGDMYFAMKAHTDEVVRNSAGVVENAYTDMQGHLREIKEEVAKGEAMTNASDGLCDFTINAKRLADICSVHSDAYKEYKRKYSPLLRSGVP